MDKIDKLKKLLELSQNDTITPKEVEQFLTTVLGFIKKSKDSFDALSAENIQTIKDCVAYLEDYNKKHTDTIDAKINLATGQMESKMSELKALIAKVKTIKPVDGKDGVNPDPEDVVPLVLAKLPKVEPFTVKREEVVREINTGKKDDIKIELQQIEGVDKLEKGVLDRAVSILDQRTKFLINKNVKHDATMTGSGTDADPLSVVGGGGGTTMSFGAPNEIPVTNATSDDFDYSADFKWNGSTKQLMLGVLDAQAEDILKVVNQTGTELTRLDEDGNLLIGIPESDQSVALGRIHVRTGASGGSTTQDLIIGPFSGSNDIETESGSTFRMGIGGTTSWVLGGSGGTGLFNHGFGTNVSPTTARMVVRGKTDDGTDNIFDGQNASAVSKFKVTNEGNVTVAGDLTVADEAYGSGWDGSTEVPTKNALYDKIETVIGTIPDNLTDFTGQTAWRVFYSNTDGDVTELALGADGTFLKSNGATSAPSFAVPSGSGGGITRTVTTSSGGFTAGATADTDYVYLIAGAHAVALPTAVGNTNRYTFKNNHSAAITITPDGAETIEGGATLSLNPSASVDLISNNSVWFVI